MQKIIFNKKQREKADFILGSPYAKLSSLEFHEIQELAIAWSYYLGKLEKCTYTYVETEALLKDGITSEKKYEHAKILINLYNTFFKLLETIQKRGVIDIDWYFIKEVYYQLTGHIVQEKKGWKIFSGFNNEKYNIFEKDIYRKLIQVEKCYNPIEKAIFLHFNMLDLISLIHRNQSISKILETVILMNADIIPVYSILDKDILNYSTLLFNFYEKRDYSQYADYFLGRQIERINSIAPSDLQYTENNTKSIKK